MQTKVIRKAESAWQLLNGLLCVYKPAGTTVHGICRDLQARLCNELNSMAVRPPEKIIQLQRIRGGPESLPKVQRQLGVVGVVPDGSTHLVKLVKKESLADHPLIVGPRYQPHDVEFRSPSLLGKNVSGVQLVGLNSGTSLSNRLYHSRWLRSFTIDGRFGLATDTHFITGRTVEKSTYHRITQPMIERILASFQASHQRLTFSAAGVPPNSDIAYELASKGMVRPATDTDTIMYSCKLLSFNPPDFQIEVHSINEKEEQLFELVHYLGLKLHSTAVCTKVRCTQYGPFGVEEALLKKHWTLENVISNMGRNADLLRDYNSYIRKPNVDSSDLKRPQSLEVSETV